jgi:hypothetical protein
VVESENQCESLIEKSLRLRVSRGDWVVKLAQPRH